MQFRKKPVVIDAMQFTTNNDPGDANMSAICKWVCETGGVASHDGTNVFIETLEGRMTASVGDWVIKGVKGEFYPCKPDIFAATYDDASGARHDGLPVAGYQPQSNTAVDLVNQNKTLEENVLRVLDNLATMKGPAASNDQPSELTVDQRWLAIGRTAIENGFMAVNRAVFKPGRVKLPGDRLPG